MRVIIDDQTLEAEIKRQQLNRDIPPSIFPIEFSHPGIGVITTNVYATIFKNSSGNIEISLLRGDNVPIFTLLSSEETPAETAIKVYNRISRLFEE